MAPDSFRELASRAKELRSCRAGSRPTTTGIAFTTPSRYRMNLDRKQTDAEKLTEEGLAEAEHDRMVEGARESRRKER